MKINKKCEFCNKQFSVDELHSYTRFCSGSCRRKSKYRENLEENRAKKRLEARKERAKNPSRIYKNIENYKEKNKDKINAEAREYYLKNKEYHRQRYLEAKLKKMMES